MDWDTEQEVFDDLAAPTASSMTLRAGEPGRRRAADPDFGRALKSTASGFLFGIEASDTRAFAAAIAALAVAAIAASALPARRAATVDPVEALRAE
jgi:ABC-type antimicrobial peptide transport system permease subunit